MTFYTFAFMIMFAAMSGLVFKLFEEVYKMFAPQYIKKDILLIKIEGLMKENDSVIESGCYPDIKRAAQQQNISLNYVKSIIDSL